MILIDLIHLIKVCDSSCDLKNAIVTAGAESDVFKCGAEQARAFLGWYAVFTHHRGGHICVQGAGLISAADESVIGEAATRVNSCSDIRGAFSARLFARKIVIAYGGDQKQQRSLAYFQAKKILS